MSVAFLIQVLVLVYVDGVCVVCTHLLSVEGVAFNMIQWDFIFI